MSDDGTSFQHEFLARIIEGLECSATRVLYSPVNGSSKKESLQVWVLKWSKNTSSFQLKTHKKDYDITILSDNEFEKLDNFLEEAVMVRRRVHWNGQVFFRIQRMDISRYTSM